MTHDVFLSYSSKDKVAADAACAVLEQKGIRCWIAPRDIRPGDDWGETIISAITDARAFLLIFSRNANASQQVKREVERAVNRGLPVIPMRIEDVLPARSLEYFLSTPHWLDAYTPPLASHLDYLAGVIRQILDGATPANGRSWPQPSRSRSSRRAVLGFGAAGVAAVAGAAGYVLWPRPPAPADFGLMPTGAAGSTRQSDAPSSKPLIEPQSKPLVQPPPPPAPRFEGKWVLASLDMPDDAWSAIGMSNVASLFEPFSRSAVAGGTLTVLFEVSHMSQYKFDVVADDHGTITRRDRNATLTSDLDHRASTSVFYLQTPEDAQNTISTIGGKEGDAMLVFEGIAPYGQFDFYGTPDPRAQGVTADIAGHWMSAFPETAIGSADRSMDITGDGHYRYHVTLKDRGMWEAADGKWTRHRQSGPSVTGTYLFDGDSRVTLANGAETMVFRRA